MSTSTTNYNFIKDDPTEYYDVSKINANLDLIDTQIKVNEIEIDQLEEKSAYKEVTLSNHAAIFSSGVGTDCTDKEQNLNSIVEGQSSVIMKGFTANNLVKNGDFSNGITNWVVSSDISYTVNDKVLSFTGVRQFNQVIQFIPTIIGHKYYISAIVKANDNKVSVNFNYASKTIFHSGSGNYELLSGVFDTDSSNTALNVVDNRSSDWSEISVSNMMCFDLTSTFGAGNEPTKEQCDLIFDHYIEGLSGTGYGKIVSIGKNLIPSNIVWEKYRYNTSGGDNTNHTATIIEQYNNYLKINAASDWYVVKNPNYYKVKPNTNYIFSIECSTNNFGGYDVIFYDAFKNYISGQYVKSDTNFITPSACRYIRFSVQINSAGDMVLTNWQLEEGTVTTVYEPYQSSEITTILPQSLHRLPNGIYDSVEEINGIRTLINKTKTITLDGDESIYYYKTYTNTIWFSIPLPDMILGTVKTKRYCNISDLSNRIYSVTLDEEGYGFGDTSATLYLGINQNRLTTIDLAGFKSWLSKNPLKIVYELANPQVIVNNTNGFSQVGNLEVYPNGTIYQYRENYPESYNNAILDITYNLTDKAVMMSNSNKITALNKEKLSANGIANNLITTEQGLVLDARQGKVLSDKITLLDSNKTTGSSIKFILNTLGWYRIAQYRAYNNAQVKGSACNSVGIDIKRMYNYANNEYYKLLLMSICDKSQWLKIGKLINTQVITKIRHTVDTSSYIAYIEIYFNFNKENEFGIELSNTKDGSVYVTSAWETITPIATSETVDNVITMSTLDLTTV